MRLLVYPIIYDMFFHIPGGERWISEPSTVGVDSHFFVGPKMVSCKPVSLGFDM